jgi:hypothetical protein
MNTALRTWRLVLLFLLISSAPAFAFRRYGPFELTGNVSAQNLLRHPDIDEYAFVQQRNTAKLRLDFDLLEKGKFLERFEIPFLERAKLLLLYRGVYDSVYDAKPGFIQKDIYGIPAFERKPQPPGAPPRYGPLHLDDLPDRDEIKFENDLREAYVDLRFKYFPLSLRLGRQQIVWGETDNFRLLDRTNALDLTWHLQQESWDELRIPYYMIKGLYDIGRIGPLSDAFLEAYWNPGDWIPNKRKFIPRPWSLPITDPLNLSLVRARFPTGDLFGHSKLFRQGNYVRSADDNSQVGVRFNAITPGSVQFTLAYFYQRWSGGDDGTNAAAIQAVLDPALANAAVAPCPNGAGCELPIEATFPYVSAFGLSANYSDEDLTQTVFRIETIYEIGVPFNDTSKRFTDDQGRPRPEYDPVIPGLFGKDVYGVTKKDMWKGTIAFDRPTWIRALNRKTTFLILGQFFWHYLLDNPDVRCIDPSEGLPCTNSGQGEGLRGALSMSNTAHAVTLADRGLTGTATGFFDRVRDWELLMTLAATTFYQGGTIMPLLVYVLDPVNSFNMEVLWSLDYFVTNNFIVNVGQKYFINTTSRPVFETWGVGGANRGRSETQLRLTYQF